MVVCHCLAINDATIRELIEAGALSVEEIGSRCGAGTECGACVEQVQRLAAHQKLVAANPQRLPIGSALHERGDLNQCKDQNR